MTRHTITLPEPIADYIDRRLADGRFESVSDYVIDLVGKEMDLRAQAEAELLVILDASEKSGISERSLEEILAHARSSSRNADRNR